MSFITGKHLPRRTFLRGMGATVALPFLDAMVPAGGLSRTLRAATAAANPTRLVCIEEVHGLAGCTTFGSSKFLYAPEKVGRDFTLVPDNPRRSRLGECTLLRRLKPQANAERKLGLAAMDRPHAAPHPRRETLARDLGEVVANGDRRHRKLGRKFRNVNLVPCLQELQDALDPCGASLCRQCPSQLERP